MSTNFMEHYELKAPLKTNPHNAFETLWDLVKKIEAAATDDYI